MTDADKPDESIDENPVWTESDFAQARPASAVHSPAIISALTRSKPISQVAGDYSIVGAAARAQGPGARLFQLAA